MKTIKMLFSILVLSLISAIASAESLINTEEYFAYEEVPILDTEPSRIVIEDLRLHEGTPTYKGDLLEEAELSAFEEIGEMQE